MKDNNVPINSPPPPNNQKGIASKRTTLQHAA
jgi:hypothetical protein